MEETKQHPNKTGRVDLSVSNSGESSAKRGGSWVRDKSITKAKEETTRTTTTT
jgi:hypothetical protein